MLGKTTIAVWLILLAALVQPVFAEEAPLATGDLIVLGARLDVAPRQMTVAVGMPCEVQTVYCEGRVEPPAAMMVKGSLRGPGLTDPVPLTTRPGQPFILEAFKRSGTYTIYDISLVLDGQAVLPAQADHVTIEVVEHESEPSDQETSRDPDSSN
ncbi:MAG: hypothetical protein AB1714_14870 [Acidobacteriota bacterium]